MAGKENHCVRQVLMVTGCMSDVLSGVKDCFNAHRGSLAEKKDACQRHVWNLL